MNEYDFSSIFSKGIQYFPFKFSAVKMSLSSSILGISLETIQLLNEKYHMIRVKLISPIVANMLKNTIINNSPLVFSSIFSSYKVKKTTPLEMSHESDEMRDNRIYVTIKSLDFRATCFLFFWLRIMHKTQIEALDINKYVIIWKMIPNIDKGVIFI